MKITPSFIEKNISIIFQGSVTRKNIHNIASHCRHWKDILPESELILSISSTYLLLAEIDSPLDTLSLLKVILITKSDEIYTGSINVINKYCDFIVYDKNTLAVPLPPIKDDASNYNNINFLIESSRNGFNFARKAYSLRIRNDAVFLNKDFIDHYCKNYSFPRKQETSVSKQRIMVSWIYTLNPFSEERLPLHISDWFHFGLTEDIKPIWEIPFLTFRDATYFENKKHQTSNGFEKRFNTRIAVEQHITLNFFKKKLPSIKLAYLNDLTSLNYFMDLTIDNFYIFGKSSSALRINKHYQEELENPHKRSVCITEDAWRFMVLNRNIDYASILKGNVDKNILRISNNKFPMETFPKRYASIHERKDLLRLLVFYLYTTLLSNKMKSKFLIHPEKFFQDSQYFITRFLGRLYLR